MVVRGKGGAPATIKLPRACHVKYQEPIIYMATRLSFLDDKSSTRTIETR